MAFLVALTFLAMITVNALANILPIGGMGTGEVSDSYPNLFAPAGITFSIWGVIYFLLALHTIYQFRKGDESIQIIFSVSSVVNIAWLFSWHYLMIGLSLLLMIVLLVCLIRINDLIDLKSMDRQSYWALAVPFSVYLGWITVATIANATAFLVSIGWSGWGISEMTWTAIVLVVGLLIALSWAFRRRDAAYLLTLVWAYTGILIKHTSQEGFRGEYPLILTVVAIAIAAFIISFGVLVLRKKATCCMKQSKELRALQIVLGLYIIFSLVLASLNQGGPPEVAAKVAPWWHFYENQFKTFLIILCGFLTYRIVKRKGRAGMRLKNFIGFAISALMIHILLPLFTGNPELYFFAMPLPWTTIPLQAAIPSSSFAQSHQATLGLDGIGWAITFFWVYSILIGITTVLFGRRLHCSHLCLFNGFAAEVFDPAIPLLTKIRHPLKAGHSRPYV